MRAPDLSWQEKEFEETLPPGESLTRERKLTQLPVWSSPRDGSSAASLARFAADG